MKKINLFITFLLILNISSFSKGKNDINTILIQKIDSIQKQCNSTNKELSILKDSLESITEGIAKNKEAVKDELSEYKISKGYFSAIIGIYSAIISIIVAIAIFIAGYLLPKKQINSIEAKVTSNDLNIKERIDENKEDLIREIENTKKSLELLIKNIKEDTEKQLKDSIKDIEDIQEKNKSELLDNYKKAIEDLNKLKHDHEFTELQVKKSMFFSCHDSESYIGACLWAMRVVNYYISSEYLDSQDENIFDFIELAFMDIMYVKKADIKDENIEEFKKIIELVKSTQEDKKVLDKVKEFEENLYKIYYS